MANVGSREMDPKQPFVLSRAKYEDLAEIASLIFHSFGPEVRKIFLVQQEEDLPIYVDALQKEWREDEDLVWMKVVDTAANKIVSIADWRVAVAPASKPYQFYTYDFITGHARDRALQIHGGMNAAKARALTGPQMHLHVCCTDAAYRRRGAGAMLIRWGVELADQLQIPAWIEASKEGNMLYRNFGFTDYEAVKHEEVEFVNMIRQPSAGLVAGGKEALKPLSK